MDDLPFEPWDFPRVPDASRPHIDRLLELLNEDRGNARSFPHDDWQLLVALTIEQLNQGEMLAEVLASAPEALQQGVLAAHSELRAAFRKLLRALGPGYTHPVGKQRVGLD